MQTSDIQPPLLHPLVGRWIEAFNAHLVANLVALYSDDAELFDSGMNRPRYGYQEIANWFTWRFRSTPTITYTPIDQRTLDDGRIAVKWIARGQGPRFFGQSRFARPFQVEGESIFTLQDTLIYRQRGSYDHVFVLRQIIPPLRWLPRGIATMVYFVYLWRNSSRH